jgi:quercetin dioxygenase-like cupin family protein
MNSYSNNFVRYSSLFIVSGLICILSLFAESAEGQQKENVNVGVPLNLGFVIILILISSISSTYCQGQSNNSTVTAKPFKFTRIYSDSTGASHFSSEEMVFSLVKFSPQLPPVSVTKPNSTANMVVISAPAGGKADWHCIPHRQFNIMLSGEIEIEVSDGEVRRFGQGSLILGEDTKGKGHITRVLSDNDVYFAVITLTK